MDEKFLHIDEINVRSVLIDLAKNAWIIVLMVASVLMSVSAYQKTAYEPKYTSSATFVVSARGNASAFSSLSTAREMATVFSEVFKSNVLRDKIVEQMDGETVDAVINTRVITETNLMVVSVTSSSPEQSFRVLNLVIENYPSISELVFGNAVLEVIKQPAVPTWPSNSFDISQYQRLGVFMAVALSTLAIVLLSILRDTVQTPKAAKRKIDGRLLGTVRYEEKNKTMDAKRRRKNIAPLITNPLHSVAFKEDNRNLCSKMEYHMRKRGQKAVLICSASENEGKSTVAANLALSLVARHKKVLLMDCDFRKPAMQKIFQLELDRTNDFGYFINHDGNDEPYNPVKVKSGLQLCAHKTGYKYVQRMINSDKLMNFVEQAKQEYDYVVLDSPPMLVAADAEALARLSDVAVLVVRQDCALSRDINDCMDTLRQSAPDVAGFVMNNCRTKVFEK